MLHGTSQWVRPFSCWWFFSNFLNSLPGKYYISITKIIHSPDNVAKKASWIDLVGTEIVSTVTLIDLSTKRDDLTSLERVKETSKKEAKKEFLLSSSILVAFLHPTSPQCNSIESLCISIGFSGLTGGMSFAFSSLCKCLCLNRYTGPNSGLCSSTFTL